MISTGTKAVPDDVGAPPAARPTPKPRRLSRRLALSLLAGLGAASLYVVSPLPLGSFVGQQVRPFPDWAYSMPRGGEAYAAAYSDLGLMGTLPCFCGCMAFEDQPHKSLRTCFESPSGEVDPHGAFCETCQDEAIEAVALAHQGVARGEIHDLIVAKYADRQPEYGGVGCGPSNHPAGAGAACAP